MTVMTNIILDLAIISIYIFIVLKTWQDRMMASRSGLLAASVAAILAFVIDLLHKIVMTEADFAVVYSWERALITFSVLAMGLYQMMVIRRNWTVRGWDGRERRKT